MLKEWVENHLERFIVGEIATKEMDVFSVWQFFGDFLLGGGDVTNEADDNIGGV